MGLSVRTADWRYTEWRFWNANQTEAIWGPSGLLGTELYSHDGDTGSDFDAFENANQASDPQNSKIVAQLAVVIHDHYSSDQ